MPRPAESHSRGERARVRECVRVCVCIRVILTRSVSQRECLCHQCVFVHLKGGGKKKEKHLKCRLGAERQTLQELQRGFFFFSYTITTFVVFSLSHLHAQWRQKPPCTKQRRQQPASHNGAVNKDHVSAPLFSCQITKWLRKKKKKEKTTILFFIFFPPAAFHPN